MSTVTVSRDAAGKTRTYMAKPGDVERKWLLVDATDKPLGRLAARLATILQGKHRATYTPHLDTGDFVVVTNVTKMKITGDKREGRVFGKYTGYPGGRRTATLGELMERNPVTVLKNSVRRMLPKGRLGHRMLGKLNAYRGAEHPHVAQKPQACDILPAGRKRTT